MTKKPAEIDMQPARAHEDAAIMPANPLMTRVTFTREELSWIREIVLIGLQSFGEVEKAIAAKELLERSGVELPSCFDIRHPTGESDTVAKFADVLRILNV